MAPVFSAFLVNASGEERRSQLAFAVRYGHGVEIRDLGWHGLLDDPRACAEVVAWYRRELPKVRGPVTVHGPAEDLSPGGEDPKIVAVSRERTVACLDAAARAGIPRAIFHTCFHHADPQPWYVEGWIKRFAAFWREALAGRTVEVCLENAWEPGPEVLRDAIEAIDLPTVGACLDVGHAHLHTPGIPPARWVEVLGPRLRHLHLHDNAQGYDQHLVPGGGTIDWVAFATALREQDLCLPATLEIPEDRVRAAVWLLQQLN
jgi:sugar phosphate isomerase/epimerase